MFSARLQSLKCMQAVPCQVREDKANKVHANSSLKNLGAPSDFATATCNTARCKFRPGRPAVLSKVSACCNPQLGCQHLKCVALHENSAAEMYCWIMTDLQSHEPTQPWLYCLRLNSALDVLALPLKQMTKCLLLGSRSCIIVIQSD